jgi:hypothetical protein
MSTTLDGLRIALTTLRAETVPTPDTCLPSADFCLLWDRVFDYVDDQMIRARKEHPLCGNRRDSAYSTREEWAHHRKARNERRERIATQIIPHLLPRTSEAPRAHCVRYALQVAEELMDAVDNEWYTPQ